MKEKFEDRRLTGVITLNLEGRGKWSADKANLCGAVVRVVEKYQEQGYRLTLRQLYYQLVSGDIIPNHDTVYKKMSGILDDLRYSGVIDWSAIEDRGRIPHLPYFANDIADAMEDIINAFRLDRQMGQDTVIEVFTEKDAISGILKRITDYFHIRLVVNKGYSSSSALHEAYKRFAGYIKSGKKVRILYFGDHDPSGLDMIRDIRERMLLFLARGRQLGWRFFDSEKFNKWMEFGRPHSKMLSDFIPAFSALESLIPDGEKYAELFKQACRAYYLHEREFFKITPIGLTMDQIREYNPPPNPAKITDPRAKWYISQFGQVSWEVDALEPAVMEGVVRGAIMEIIDFDKFKAVCEKEDQMTKEMKAFAKSRKINEEEE